MDTNEERRSRLARYAGLPCPLCKIKGLPVETLSWSSHMLICPRGHGWRDPHALVAELREAYDMKPLRKP